VLVALVFGLGLAGIASYSILFPLRQLQGHIKRIGQGHFGTPLQIAAPPELRELVDTVNWMGEKLQELDDMKAEFLAHVSHELRTPMASIQEGTHLLLDEIPGPLKADQRTTLLIMADSSRRLIHLISTILDLSKMEAGMMEYRIVPTELRRIADLSVNKVQLLADAKHVQVFIEHPEERLWVKADGARIEQVLDNLLSNALKFSPEGSSVKIQITPDQKAGTLEVAVSDSGPGIAPEDLPYIFERFYQGKNKPKHTLAGSGLGLALAKKVVEAHGGGAFGSRARWGRIQRCGLSCGWPSPGERAEHAHDESGGMDAPDGGGLERVRAVDGSVADAAALFHRGSRGCQSLSSAGQETRGLGVEMQRDQFVRSCVFYARAAGAL